MSRAAVLLEGGTVRVEFPAVELDDQAGVRPERVDLVAVDEHVGLRLRQAVGDDEGREAVLERGAGVFDMALLGEEEGPDGFAGRPSPRVMLVEAGDLGHAEKPQPGGFVPGALELVRRGAFGQVEERTGDSRDGDPVAEGDVGGSESAAMAALMPEARPGRTCLPRGAVTWVWGRSPASPHSFAALAWLRNASGPKANTAASHRPCLVSGRGPYPYTSRCTARRRPDASHRPIVRRPTPSDLS